MRKIWLIFAQSVTACLGLLFVLRLFYPQFLEATQTPIVIKQATPEVASVASAPKSGFSNAVKKAMPAVVNIFTSTKPTSNNRQPYMDDPVYRHFFGDPQENLDEEPENSLGSGVIVSEQGLILTNNHVVATADQIEVALGDGRKLVATVVGTDPETDLAVLRIDADKLPSITFAANDKLAVGDVVLAIGNPFGVGQNVTQGIVSALGRSRLGINPYENSIQTDASINPGNSGGALIDSDGNLVGINSAIYSRSGGSMGIGFAIPASLAKQVMEQIVVNGSVVRGWVGIEAQDVTDELAESFKLKESQGALIAGVLRDSPADRAGLKAGDILTQIGGKPVADAENMLNLIAALKPNEKVTLSIVRDGINKNIDVIIGRRPKPMTVER